jgi:phytoene dehydrogenase-like protein
MGSGADVIVVGAGLGGLVAAARLVQAGLQVLVLDRNPHVAGTAWVFNRAGFTFPMGPLGFSSPHLVQKTISELAPGAEWSLERVHYRLRAFGLNLPLSLPRPALQAAFILNFPREADGITRFFERVGRVFNLLREPPSEKNRAALEAAANEPAREYLDSLIGDWRLRRVLGSQGSSEPYAALPLLAAMWGLMTEEGIWYPEGGLRVLGGLLQAAVLSPKGRGEIRLGSEVERIRTQKGKVTGVRLVSGETLEAPVVISNGDFKTTFLQLLDQHEIAETLRREVAAARQTGSNLQLSLGLNGNKVDLSAFEQSSRIIYQGEGEEPPPDWSAPKIDPPSLAAGQMELCLWSADDSALAPAGRAVLVIRVDADHGHFVRFRPARSRRLAGYREYKLALGRALAREAENIIPGLNGAIETLDVATPLTFEERGGRSEGAVAGWSWNYEDGRDATPRELIRTPVGGLFMVGYQAFSALFLGGVPTALESGNRAAAYILEGRGPVAEFHLPGSLKK